MPLATPIYLVDTSGQQWQLATTNSPARWTTTEVSGKVAFTSILLHDIATSQVWKLTVVPSPPPAGMQQGDLRVDISGSATAKTQIVVNSPDGSLFGIQIENGLVETVPATLPGTTCPYPLSTAFTALAARLYDPTNQFWSQPELLLY